MLRAQMYFAGLLAETETEAESEAEAEAEAEEGQGSKLKASMEKNTQRRILSIWEEIEERFLYLDTDTPSLYLFPNRETFLLSVFGYLGYCKYLGYCGYCDIVVMDLVVSFNPSLSLNLKAQPQPQPQLQLQPQLQFQPQLQLQGKL